MIPCGVGVERLLKIKLSPKIMQPVQQLQRRNSGL
jgi:hypothetical protein